MTDAAERLAYLALTEPALLPASTVGKTKCLLKGAHPPSHENGHGLTATEHSPQKGTIRMPPLSIVASDGYRFYDAVGAATPLLLHPVLQSSSLSKYLLL